MDEREGGDVRQRLVAMRDTLVAVLIVIRSVADEHRGDFAEASPARIEWESSPAEVAHHLQEAYRTGVVPWHSIGDHGYALADLIAGGRTYAGMTVARSLAEASARSWYLLDDGLEPRERIRRMINDRLYAAHENVRLFTGVLPSADKKPETLVVARAAEQLIRGRISGEQRLRSDLLDFARNLGLRPIKQPKDKPAFVVQARPSGMTLLGRLLDSASDAASFFRLNSAVAHASLHGQSRMIYISRREDGENISIVRPMHPDDLAPQAWPGVAAMALAARALFRQAGWSPQPLEAAVSRLFAAWNPPPSADVIAEFEALT